MAWPGRKGVCLAAVRAESCQNSLEAERQALEDGAATSEPAAEGCPTATSPDDAAQHLGFDSRPGQAGTFEQLPYSLCSLACQGTSC